MKPVIVFVDDEPNILQGLKRYTRTRRNVWDMHFFERAGDAAALATSEHVDVVVSDMRMPEINGADLLEQISSTAPGTIRFILSGEAELKQTYRTVGRSHRFLAKPCDPDGLVKSIEEVLELRAKLGEDVTKDGLPVFDHLCSPSDVFDELALILDGEEPSINEVLQLVRRDPNLTIRILQLANSGYFGRPLQTLSIEKATTFIGVATLRDLFELKRLGNSNSHINMCDVDVQHYREAAILADRIASTAPDVVDLGSSVAFYATLGALSAIPASQTETLSAAYMAGLFGMPHALTQSLLDLKTFNLNSSLDERLDAIRHTAIQPGQRMAG